VAAPDNYHPPLNLDFKLTLDSQPTFLTTRHNYGQGDYLLFYNTLSNYYWSCVLNENSVDSAVYNFTDNVSETINETIPFVKPTNSSFLHWFSKSLIYYIKKKIFFFKKYKKSKSDFYYSILSYYSKLVKINRTVDRLDWLKTIDNGLRTQPKHFWKYISKFKRNDQSVTKIQIGNKNITQPQLIADVFAVHFSPIFNSSSSVRVPNNSDCISSHVLNISYISNSDVERNISRLRSTKCVGPDELPNFITKGCSEILAPLLCHIFNLSLLTGKFNSLC
jgi:hypothetical protein